MIRAINILVVLSLLFVGCTKEPDSPPENILSGSKVITIDSLRSWQQGASPELVTITDSLHLYAIVTMDESEGNIYKNLYVQDHTGAINMRLTAGSDFAVGDSLRISLVGAVLSEYSGVIQLDNIDPDNAIIRQSAGHDLTPQTMSLSDITIEDEGKLVRITNVQFANSELLETYADAANQESEDRIIEECGTGNQMIVRTSGFANFADEVVAQNKGDLVCIVSRFNDVIQLIIRDFDEINLTGERCAGQIFVKDFDDESINSGGWITVVVNGIHNWETNDMGHSSFYAQMSNWDSGNTASETWLISPVIDLSSGSGSMSFMNAYNFTGDPLQLMVSTDFPGSGDPNLSTWTDISGMVNWSTGSFDFVDSGTIDLSSFNSATVYIAFKYTGTDSSGSTWELDDITVNG